MTLMPFSIPDHVEKLLSGAKRQTTRQPRKRPLNVGDVLHCYFRPRMKKGCLNCISDCSIVKRRSSEIDISRYPPCDKHNNFFGKAKVTGILHCNNIFAMNSNKFDFATQTFKLSEKWINGFDSQPKIFMEAWARGDGFANLQEAHKWFSKSTRNDQWMFQSWDVIIFEPLWLVGED